MISGMWLTIGTERVPGKIFEKRAAMWVYQKITEVRPVPRDPAILRYVGPNLAELKVYPVETSAPRVVEVEFLYPDGLNPQIRIGNESATSAISATNPGPNVGVAADGNFVVSLPEKVTAAFPVTDREPYFHFLVDASKDSAFKNPEALRDAIRKAAAAFPSIRDARLSFVNFETQDFQNGDLLTIDALHRMPGEDLHPGQFRGGFLDVRAIKEVLWRSHLALSVRPDALQRFPRLVVLHGSSQSAPLDERSNLAEFARLLPDSPGYWSLGRTGSMDFMPFDSNIANGPDQPVRIFEVGGQRFAASTQGSISYTSIAASQTSPDSIAAYDPASGQFGNSQSLRPVSPEYGRAAMPWSVELGRIFEPYTHRKDSLGKLLGLCRETGILVPSAAYMVVEDTAQWKMIVRAEKKTMKGHEALELSETIPEPATMVLVVAGLAWLMGGRLLRKRQAVPS